MGCRLWGHTELDTTEVTSQQQQTHIHDVPIIRPWNSPGENAAAAKSFQSCPTLCDPIDGSPPGSPVPGILQARTLERVAVSFSNA